MLADQSAISIAKSETGQDQQGAPAPDAVCDRPGGGVNSPPKRSAATGTWRLAAAQAHPAPSKPASSTNLRPCRSRVGRRRWSRCLGWGAGAGLAGQRRQRPRVAVAGARNGQAAVLEAWRDGAASSPPGRPRCHDECEGSSGQGAGRPARRRAAPGRGVADAGADGGRGQPGRRCPRGQRNPDRVARRNGYRQQAWDNPGRPDRPCHPQAAVRVLRPQLPGAAPPQQADPRRRGPAGHGNGNLDLQSRAAGRGTGLAGRPRLRGHGSAKAWMGKSACRQAG
jgi:hypothetical protein